MAATLGEYLKKSAYIINEGNKLESFNQKLEKLTGHYSRLSTFKKASIEDILALRMADGSKVIKRLTNKEKELIISIQKNIRPSLNIERNFIILLTTDFISRITNKIDTITVDELNCNPILCRALKLDTPTKLIRFYTYSAVSRSIVTSLGNLIQDLLLYSSDDVFNGKDYEKVGNTRWDIVIERLGLVKTYIEVKAGTNTMDKTQVLEYLKAVNAVKSSPNDEDAMIGMACGSYDDDTVAMRQIKKDAGANWESYVKVGRDLWEFVANKEGYNKILINQIQETAQACLHNINIVTKIENRIKELINEFNSRYVNMNSFIDNLL